MKYYIVILFTVILLMLVGFEYQFDIMTDKDFAISELKQSLSQQNNIISLLETQRVYTKTPVFLFPLVMADYEDISSYYSNRLYPLRKNAGGTLYKFHPAIDITGSEGARCKLIAKAVVKDKWHEAGWHYVNGAWREYSGHGDYNGYVIFKLLDEWEGWEAGYGHIANITVHEGDIVEAGYEFAIINPEIDAKSTGSHVHFWLKKPSGEFVNPMNYIGKI